ncbi:zinc finger protein 235-like [Periplaneta americana]|uniref:zinc finger protein 235-like n=1 Tax=Periplaneta americana TaxID=6978 RepID=UPI0037E765EB
MDYGLWNLHGGFWASNAACGADSVTRTLYNTVTAGSSGPFHGCADGLSFASAAASPPCRSSYRSQPEFVAMKPSIVVSRSSSGVSESSKGQSEDRAEQSVCKPTAMSLQNDAMVEHSSVESVNSVDTASPLTLTPGSRPESTSSQQSNKKLKLAKHPRKGLSAIGRSDSNIESPWSRAVKTENPLQYLNHQYNPMYSMMFGRLPNKHLDTASDVSEDEDEDEEEEEEEEDDNDNDVGEGESFGSQPNRSPNRTTSHSNSRLGYECGECGLVADTRPSLKKHIAICHPAPGPDPNLAHALLSKMSSSCPMASCRFHTSERDEMEAHVARHVAEGYSPTGKKRAGPVSLQRVRYEREEYRCQMCAYTCTIEKAFYKHLKLHSLGLNVSSVKISCVICGKDRPTEVDMNKHMRRHRDNRYFCCDICIFRTVQLKKLIQHRRMHTGEKPHLCPHCAYRSARRDNLRSHVRRVHKKENLYCDTFSPRGLLLTATSTTQQDQPEPASPTPSQN